MAITFILGRAGTGKSRRCLEEIGSRLAADPQGHPLILLVPEQATFQAEQAIVSMPGLGGLIRAQVTSFRRLAWRVIQETGGSAAVPIDDLGKTMLLKRLIHKHQDHLRLFANAADKFGFMENLNSFFKDLQRNCIGPEELSAQQAAFSADSTAKQPQLRDKLDDLALLYREYRERLDEQYLDGEYYLTRLADKVHASGWLCEAEIWVDGFYGFTPQEIEALAHLERHCRGLTVTFCLDRPYESGEIPEELDLFHATGRSMALLRQRISEWGTSAPDIQLLKPETAHRFAESPMLAHLERNFDRRLTGSRQMYREPEQTQHAQPQLSVYAAVHRKAEVEGCAREMLRLVREQGLRWRDFSVMVRNLDEYGDLLSLVLSEWGIPFFLDQKRTVLSHPLVEFIRSALEVAARNWRYDAVFRCVKTNLLLPLDPTDDNPVSLDARAMDELENFVLATGISGKSWRQSRVWEFERKLSIEGDTLTDRASDERIVRRLQACRGAVVDAFSGFEDRLKEAGSISEMAAAVFDMLAANRIPEKLERWEMESLNGGKPEQAKQHRQVWEAVVDLLDQLVEIMGEDRVDLTEFAQLLETGLETISLAIVPPSLDQVLVGSIDRTRTAQRKFSFVLGVNEGVIPAKGLEDGILSDTEKERLQQSGLRVPDGSRRKLLDEQLLVYSVLCGPSRHLWLSYPLADEEGKSLLPSQIIRQVKSLFPGITVGTLAHEPHASMPVEEQAGYAGIPDKAASCLTVRLKEWMNGEEMPAFWWSVYNALLSKPEWKERLGFMLRAVDFANEEPPLQPETGLALYGDRLRASVTRMEKFVSCPFSQFVSYGLRLRERRVYRLEAPDIGRLYHAALNRMAEHIHGIEDLNLLPPEQIAAMAFEVVDELAPRLQEEILFSSSRYKYISRQLKGIVGRTSLIMAEHAKRGSFAPVGLELGFGPGEQLPPLTFQLENGRTMDIVGRIDRVDRAYGPDGMLLRIIDYKSSPTGLSLNKLYNGLSLQMLTYLDVVVTYAERWLGQAAEPAGVLYFHVHNPIVRSPNGLDPESAEKALRKEFKLKGLVSADVETVRLMDAGMKEKNGHSEWVPVAIKADGSFYKNASVATGGQWDALRSYVRKEIQRIGTGITEGEVGIEPYRLKKQSACQYCSYKPVCQFDPLLAGNGFHVLDHKTNEQVWQSLGAGNPAIIEY